MSIIKGCGTIIWGFFLFILAGMLYSTALENDSNVMLVVSTIFVLLFIYVSYKIAQFLRYKLAKDNTLSEADLKKKVRKSSAIYKELKVVFKGTNITIPMDQMKLEKAMRLSFYERPMDKLYNLVTETYDAGPEVAAIDWLGYSPNPELVVVMENYHENALAWEPYLLKINEIFTKYDSISKEKRSVAYRAAQYDLVRELINKHKPDILQKEFKLEALNPRNKPYEFSYVPSRICYGVFYKYNPNHFERKAPDHRDNVELTDEKYSNYYSQRPKHNLSTKEVMQIYKDTAPEREKRELHPERYQYDD